MAEATMGITLGDPTGVGPELLARLLCDPQLRARWAGAEPVRIWVYGDDGVLGRAAAAQGLRWPPRDLPGLQLRAVTALRPAEARPGQPSLASGAAQVAYLEAAMADAAAGRVHGLCTGPLHKASALAAGMMFPGQTELLAARLGGEAVMMLAGPSLRVALCTTHLPLRAVAAALSVAGLVRVLRTTVLGLVADFGIQAPRVWVAGLNPHAGEQGNLGREEQEVVAPAIARARALPELAALPGLEIVGPQVPDVVFRQAVHPPDGRRPDAVVAMYHDQGLIPLKLLDFDEAVNVTLGLPVPRTAPDHGTAHDLAGTGRARPHSLAAALRLCREIVARRQHRGG
ncbi:MAG: 4-hydroxythreonine-4-phosphate dehydrogenase PdxA [Myxococcales bacterium]|nr:4-hydroxythreonine-4-phosphate dehydrogenase PdxA [Myxococcales bacterium]